MSNLLIVLILCGSLYAHVSLKEITLYSNQSTTSNSPIPQMQCSGSACDKGALQSMDCTKMNGTDWSCRADIDNSYRLENVLVSCEGNESWSSHSLVGRCSVQYELNFKQRRVHIFTVWNPLTESYQNLYFTSQEIILYILVLLMIPCVILARNCDPLTHDMIIYIFSDLIHSCDYYDDDYYFDDLSESHTESIGARTSRC